ncbi:MAG: hypothetical protein ACE5IK_06510 [Acidobacteriota bacterium]
MITSRGFGRRVVSATSATIIFAVAGVGVLTPRPVPAQDVHEILVGTLGDMPSDVFNCGRKGIRPECGLTYRYFCVDKPDEINSPALPADGIARYRPRLKIYMADAVHTGNFPGATSLGAGHAWNLVWDGIKDADSAEHIGYYAAVSQIVNYSELGNPLTSTCLPVTGQYACFGQFKADKGAAVQNTPLGEIVPVGGLSPTPVPIIIRNGDDAVSLVWEQAAAAVSRDGAPLPIEGYHLYVYPDPVTPPTEPELQEAAIQVGDLIPVTTTSMDLARSDPALARLVTFSAAIRVVYSGGVETLHFSANGPATGVAFEDTSATSETDDATAAGGGGVSRAIDIEHLFAEIRKVKNAQDADQDMFVSTVDLVGEPTGKLLAGTTVRVFIDFNDEGLADTAEEPGKSAHADVTLSATIAAEGGGVPHTKFSGVKGIEAHSRVDSKTGHVVFAVPMDELLASVSNAKLRASDVGGKRRILIWAESAREKDRDRVPNTNDGDGPTIASEAVAFTF